MIRRSALFAIVLAFAAGCLVTSAVRSVAASRPAQPVPGLVPWPSPAALSGAPSRVAIPAGGATSNTSSGDPLPDSSAKRRVPAALAQPAAHSPAAPTTRPSPSGTPRAARPARVVASGVASFMDPSYGALYLALPLSLGGRGVLVSICSVERCITRRSNDVGPVASLHRVADLSYRDAAFLCGCDPYVPGLIAVEVRR